MFMQLIYRLLSKSLFEGRILWLKYVITIKSLT